MMETLDAILRAEEIIAAGWRLYSHEAIEGGVTARYVAVAAPRLLQLKTFAPGRPATIGYVVQDLAGDFPTLDEAVAALIAAEEVEPSIYF